MKKDTKNLLLAGAALFVGSKLLKKNETSVPYKTTFNNNAITGLGGMKRYKSMKSAALALERMGVNVKQSFFRLKRSDLEKVEKVMKNAKTFSRNYSTGKSAIRDFYDRLEKYV